jgi:hypothetical protein
MANRFLSTMKQSRVSKAVETLNQLHRNTPSKKFSKDMEKFATSKNYNLDIFIEGISLFTEIANRSSDQRKEYYGSPLFGLHYSNDLMKLWNSSSSVPIKAYQIQHICPPDWDYELGDGYITLIYRGDSPSSGLNKLLQGPTIIDCGMFCQLSIWFGIRYMLGNEPFNQVFSHSPFYLTQFVYNSIKIPTAPYNGNPLHPFFTKGGLQNQSTSRISITHVYNHKLYQLKHPGGSYGGDNCLVIDNRYTIFDPTLEVTSNLSRQDVEQLLLEALNAPQDICDKDRLALYAEGNSRSENPKLNMSYGELIRKSDELATFEAKEITLDSSATTLHIQFDFEKFCAWVNQIKNPDFSYVIYYPLRSEQLKVPSSLIEQIPYENKATMSFSTFIVQEPIQIKMHAIAKKFCLDIMSMRSACTILTGQAGIGKTASAVSCAKELSSRGKRIIWISEVMVKGWTEQARSMEDLNACQDKIRMLLTSQPDVVFLDDNNLIGYAGKVLLEELYAWYVNYPNKGLFITSNEKISFKDCYGAQLDGAYHFPPFPGYTSPQYINMISHSGLSGKSMRLTPVSTIMAFSDEERITALVNYCRGASVGIIVSSEVYQAQKYQLPNVELVPAFPEGIFNPMTKSLISNGKLGPTYNDLTPEQKKYTKRFPVNKNKFINGRIIMTDEYWYTGINVRTFERTNCNVIAVELLHATHYSGKDIINKDCLDQLLRVINYAYDSGGRKIILVNKTKFSHSEMLDKIKEDIPKREKERTLARIDALFFSPELVTATYQEESPRQEQKATTYQSQGGTAFPYVLSPAVYFSLFSSPFSDENNSVLLSLQLLELIACVHIKCKQTREAITYQPPKAIMYQPPKAIMYQPPKAITYQPQIISLFRPPASDKNNSMPQNDNTSSSHQHENLLVARANPS